MRQVYKFTLISMILLALAGCSTLGGSTAQAPEPEQDPGIAIPTDTLPVEATVTAVPPTEMPTETTQPPAPPASATPSATAQAMEIAESGENRDQESTPTPEATALPDGWYGPPDWPENMNPLTGEIVEDPALLERRPIAIKVSNYPALVRPQRGLNNTDLVFEHYAEGGATRFTAVFYSKDAHTVGSVRSARIIDFEIPVMYDAAFGFSGAAGANKERFSEVDWFDRIVSPDFKNEGFYRMQSDDPDVDFWHLMFTDTYRLREILQSRGKDTAPQFQNGMIFSEEPLAGGTVAEQVEIGYSGSYVVWWYDAGTGRYYRWNDGARHNDANTGQQISTKNVVVIAAEHVDTWIPETEVGQGAKSIEIQIWGEGPASIFRDGQRYEGRWHRDKPEDMITFSDLEGSPLPLGIGNSWFELVPLGFDKLYVTS